MLIAAPCHSACTPHPPDLQCCSLYINLYVISIRYETYDRQGVYATLFLCAVHPRDGFRLLGTCHTAFGNKLVGAQNLLRRKCSFGHDFSLFFTVTLIKVP